MIKQKTVLEVKIGDNLYELHCPGETVLGELHDALMQMKGYCVARMVKAQQDEEEISEQLKKEETTDE